MSQFIESTTMAYYDINNFLETEQKVDVFFNVDIASNKMYKGATAGKKFEIPAFASKVLLLNDYCFLYKKIDQADNKNDLTIFETLREHLTAQADIVDLKSVPFYTFLNIFRNNEISHIRAAEGDNVATRRDDGFIQSVFFFRMGEFAKMLTKKDFSEEDIRFLSSEERNIIINARQIYQQYASYEIDLIR